MNVLRTIISLIIGLSTLPMSHAKVLIDTEQSSDQMRQTLEAFVNDLEKPEHLQAYEEADLLDTADYALKNSDLEMNKLGAKIVHLMGYYTYWKKIEPHYEYPIDVYFEKKPSLKANMIRLLDNLQNNRSKVQFFSAIHYAKPSKAWEAFLINHYEKEKNADKWVAEAILQMLSIHGYQSPQTLAVMKDALNYPNTRLEIPALQYAETYTPLELFPLLIQLLETETKENTPIHSRIEAITSYGALAKPYTALMRERVSQAKGNAAKPVIQNLLEQHIEDIEALPEPEPEPEPEIRSKSFNTLVVIALGLTLVLTGFFFLKPKA